MLCNPNNRARCTGLHETLRDIVSTFLVLEAQMDEISGATALSSSRRALPRISLHITAVRPCAETSREPQTSVSSSMLCEILMSSHRKLRDDRDKIDLCVWAMRLMALKPLRPLSAGFKAGAYGL